MKIITEKKVYNNYYAGTVDLITGIDDFESNIEFIEETHTYKKNGIVLPSVTTLLNPYQPEYYDPYEEFLFASQYGTTVHKEIELFLTKNIEGKSHEFKEFKKLFKNNPDIFEQIAIFDYKTYSECEKKQREKCYYQIALYARAIYDMTGIAINNAYMVWLPRNQYSFIKNKNESQIIDLTEEFGPIFKEIYNSNKVIDWKVNNEFVLYNKEFISIGLPNVLLSKKRFIDDAYKESKKIAKEYLPELLSNLMTNTQAIFYYNYLSFYKMNIPNNFWIDYSSNFYRANNLIQPEFNENEYSTKVIVYIDTNLDITGNGTSADPYIIEKECMKNIQNNKEKELFIKKLLKAQNNKRSGAHIIMCDDNLIEIKKFASYNEAATFLNINAKSIRDAVNGKQVHAGGYKWKYDEDFNYTKRKPNKLDGISFSHEGRHIYKLDEDGNILEEFISINEAAKSTGVNAKSIRDAANDKQQHAGGFRWEFKD